MRIVVHINGRAFSTITTTNIKRSKREEIIKIISDSHRILSIKFLTYLPNLPGRIRDGDRILTCTT